MNDQQKVLKRMQDLQQAKVQSVAAVRDKMAAGEKDIGDVEIEAAIATVRAEVVDQTLRRILGGLTYDSERLRELGLEAAEQDRAAQIADLEARAAATTSRRQQKDLLAEAKRMGNEPLTPVEAAETPNGFSAEVPLADFESILADPLDAKDPQLAAFIMLCQKEIREGFQGIPAANYENWVRARVGFRYAPAGAVGRTTADQEGRCFAVGMSTDDDGEQHPVRIEQSITTAGGVVYDTVRASLTICELYEDLSLWSWPAEE